MPDEKMKSLMQRLMSGNERFITGNPDRIAPHAVGQQPNVVILTCADSRVPPELIFDAWLGEIFTVRVAGNVAYESSVIESLEYAVVHLGVPLLMIMGHTGCGAVKAAEDQDSPSGLLGEVALSFSPNGDHVIDNVRRQVLALPDRSQTIANAISKDRLTIKGAVYDLKTGKVEFL
jgi:carbonic anhydrase